MGDKQRRNLVTGYKLAFAVRRKRDGLTLFLVSSNNDDNGRENTQRWMLFHILSGLFQITQFFFIVDEFLQLGPVVQTLDSAIHRINLYPVDSAIGFPNTYPLDSDLSDG